MCCVSAPTKSEMMKWQILYWAAMLCRVVLYQLSAAVSSSSISRTMSLAPGRIRFPQTVCGFCAGHLIRGFKGPLQGSLRNGRLLLQNNSLSSSACLTVVSLLSLLWWSHTSYRDLYICESDLLCLLCSRVMIFGIFFYFYLFYFTFRVPLQIWTPRIFLWITPEWAAIMFHLHSISTKNIKLDGCLYAVCWKLYSA